MKNAAIVLGLLVLLSVGTRVEAREDEPERGDREEVEDRREDGVPSTPKLSPVAEQKRSRDLERLEKQEDSDSDDEIENENEDEDEIENENEDEDFEATEEARRIIGKKPSPRSEVAREHMSVVSLRVEELLANRTEQGGIGEQVRVIAREQQQAQLRIEDELEEVDDRSGLVRLIIGPKFQALKNVEDQIESNTQRINLLQALKDQLPIGEDSAQLDSVIQALTEQNETLQNRVMEEESAPSLLGWLLKRFQ